MENWNNICITDKTGAEYFKVSASPLSTSSEIKNLEKHIKQANRFPKMYSFIDIETAYILLNGIAYSQHLTKEDEDLLSEIFKDI